MSKKGDTGNSFDIRFIHNLFILFKTVAYSTVAY
jgi:hypothetical protein